MSKKWLTYVQCQSQDRHRIINKHRHWFSLSLEISSHYIDGVSVGVNLILNLFGLLSNILVPFRNGFDQLVSWDCLLVTVFNFWNRSTENIFIIPAFPNDILRFFLLNKLFYMIWKIDLTELSICLQVLRLRTFWFFNIV